MRADASQLPLPHDPNQRGHRHFGQLPPQLHQGQTRLLIERPHLAVIGALLRKKGFELGAVLQIKPHPAQHRTATDPALVGEGNLPFSPALLAQQRLLLAMIEPDRADKLGNDAKTEDRHLLFLLFGHTLSP